MNLEDRIASGAFTLIAEIGVNYYDIARQRPDYLLHWHV